MPALEIRDLVVEYRTGGYTVRPIEHMSLTAERGELVVLLGPSGCGKTTLLSCIGGILSPTSGSITVDGATVTALGAKELTAYRREKVGIVFQGFNLVPSLTARENVAIPLIGGGISRRQASSRADQLLAMVDMEPRASHRPGALSGGQQQRVAIARALAHDPPLILADEPTANLDYVQAESVISLLRELRGSGRLIVVSTHDHRLVPIADRVVRMAPEVASHHGPPQRIEYVAGETIFEQGSLGQYVYVVEDGKVEILRELADGTAEVLTTVGPGEYFGELGPMLGFPRSATARASTDVALTAYGIREFREEVVGSSSPASETV